MADTAPLPAKSRPLRGVEIPASFRIEAVDDVAEEGIGHDLRQKLRKEFNIPDDASVLHPDQPSLSKRAAATPAPKPGPQKPIIPAPKAEPPPPTGPPAGQLGIALSKFVGEFQGNGFNTILRPQNGKFGQGTSDNLLELNFTHETMTFLAEDVLGDVPNRGFNRHPDVNLRGIPYTQRIKDLTNTATGKADLPIKTAKGIHFEQGLFMRTPAVHPWIKTTKKNDKGVDEDFFTRDDNPELTPTISRMASIPHGTTINAQARDPEQKDVITGPPVFKDLNKQKILPFFIGTPERLADFFEQIRWDTGPTVDRIPLDLDPFREKTITRAQFENPENFLEKHNSPIKGNILKHITFEVDTKPKPDQDPKISLWGGGTDNIQQLAEGFRKDSIGIVRMVDFDEGNFPDNRVSTANASAAQMTCRYWISDVEDTITIPVYKQADLPRINNDPELIDDKDNIVWPVVGPPAKEGVRKPYFKIKLPENKEETKAKVVYTQIQYSQNVSLNFGPLTWPHISVATLVPAHPVEITDEKQLKRFK